MFMLTNTRFEDIYPKKKESEHTRDMAIFSASATHGGDLVSLSTTKLHLGHVQGSGNFYNSPLYVFFNIFTGLEITEY